MCSCHFVLNRIYFELIQFYDVESGNSKERRKEDKKPKWKKEISVRLWLLHGRYKLCTLLTEPWPLVNKYFATSFANRFEFLFKAAPERSHRSFSSPILNHKGYVHLFKLGYSSDSFRIKFCCTGSQGGKEWRKIWAENRNEKKINWIFFWIKIEPTEFNPG